MLAPNDDMSYIGLGYRIRQNVMLATDSSEQARAPVFGPFASCARTSSFAGSGFVTVRCRGERPYWEEFFDVVRVQDAHDRRKCRDFNGTEPWACDQCDCTARLEKKLSNVGKSFLNNLAEACREH